MRSLARQLMSARTYFFCLTIALTIYLLPLQATTNKLLLGVYYGNNGWEMDRLQAMEKWQDKQHTTIALFANWCDSTTDLDNLFGQQLVKIWGDRHVPSITWEPFSCNASATPSDIEVKIANGDLDSYINRWADRMKTFLSGADGIYNTQDDRRAYIRLAHEMNGNWYPWSAAQGTRPTDYVRMWRHVKSLFFNKGMHRTHLQWIWCVNATDVGNYKAESFYPGNNYVDWVGIDGYNWGQTQAWSQWQDPAQVFGNMLHRLHRITSKPVAIGEMATTTTTTAGNQIAAKSQWITKIFKYTHSHNIKAIAWFNQDKETDWAVFGGDRGDSTFVNNGKTYKTYSAYKLAIRDRSWISANTKNLRLITDAEFAGL
ncbi:MAG: Endoglucanase H [Chroococcidiopsis sp. SAG 2025]|nr:Endoglucanase H [Chroococcidiopsis sp. SAG 2025]